MDFLTRLRGELEFCPHCDVTMDLHPDDSGDPWSCSVAESKARLLEDFGIFR